MNPSSIGQLASIEAQKAQIVDQLNAMISACTFKRATNQTIINGIALAKDGLKALLIHFAPALEPNSDEMEEPPLVNAFGNIEAGIDMIADGMGRALAAQNDDLTKQQMLCEQQLAAVESPLTVPHISATPRPRRRDQ